MSLEKALARVDDGLEQSLERLSALMRIPSVSTDPAFADSCDAAADWLVGCLGEFGVQARSTPTGGRPAVIGHAGEGGPRLLFYGHYDVQPVDPLELWRTDPFEPVIEDTPQGRVIRGRGASDDKGQLMTFLEACRAWTEAFGALPCSVSFLLEGEEECGSPSLEALLAECADELAADLALVCDTAMAAPGTPSIVTRLRGMMSEEFALRGPPVDLHSGDYGGPALNPLKEISRIVASFHDADGRVAVAGFDADAGEVSAETLRQWQACGFDEAAFLTSAGARRPHGDPDHSTLAQLWARPTLEVNGLWGGYQGEGMKTVIPAEARCKITCRLVGGMDPDDVRAKIRRHVAEQADADARIEWIGTHSGSPAMVTDTGRPEFEKARRALTEEWDREAVFSGMGGSIPVVRQFSDVLGLDSMLIGFALPDDAIHSPNEKYDVESFRRGTRSWLRILDALAA